MSFIVNTETDPEKVAISGIAMRAAMSNAEALKKLEEMPFMT